MWYGDCESDGHKQARPLTLTVVNHRLPVTVNGSRCLPAYDQNPTKKSELINQVSNNAHVIAFSLSNASNRSTPHSKPRQTQSPRPRITVTFNCVALSISTPVDGQVHAATTTKLMMTTISAHQFAVPRALMRTCLRTCLATPFF
jgi:hypothetical protein